MIVHYSDLTITSMQGLFIYSKCSTRIRSSDKVRYTDNKYLVTCKKCKKSLLQNTNK
jgi:hypothetical protein